VGKLRTKIEGLFTKCVDIVEREVDYLDAASKEGQLEKSDRYTLCMYTETLGKIWSSDVLRDLEGREDDDMDFASYSNEQLLAAFHKLKINLLENDGSGTLLPN